MLNNGLSWNQDGENHIQNTFSNQEQVRFVHFYHMDMIRYINRTASINTQFPLSGKAIQEKFNYKRVILGRIELNKEALYTKANVKLTNILKEYFNHDILTEIDGRTMSAVFRRFDLLERYLKNPAWWDLHMKS